ncbi:methyltransferase domain-containing protein [Candidatus Dojkabacteria bacterium]|jgi:SAM-dependent methyltransferase|nr:methyltransferase domain-containing protein [Candidatus Dojkabacteria bacterium]
MLLNKVSTKLTKLIEFPFQVLSSQIKQNECQSLKDNILLWKLRYRAPVYFDRALEYPWAIKNITIQGGKLLDIGSTVSEMFSNLLPKTVEVYAINLTSPKNIQNVKYVTGDIRATDFKDNLFDVITCISTLEHIGVEGRYKVKKDEFGDIKAMKEMLRILKPGGTLLLTVPYGAKDVLPINKLYNKERIDELSKGYVLESATYQKYDEKYSIWREISELEASKVNWLKEKWYALALIKLSKPK